MSHDILNVIRRNEWTYLGNRNLNFGYKTSNIVNKDECAVDIITVNLHTSSHLELGTTEENNLLGKP